MYKRAYNLLKNRLSHDYNEAFAKLSFDDIVWDIIFELNAFTSFMKTKYE